MSTVQRSSVVLAGILAVGLTGCGGQAHNADVVLVIPPETTDDPMATASTYAGALSSSDDLVGAVAESTGADPAHLAEHLVAIVEDGTSVLRLSYAGEDDQEVLAVLDAATAILTGPQPPEPVNVGTLVVVSQAEVVPS